MTSGVALFRAVERGAARHRMAGARPASLRGPAGRRSDAGITSLSLAIMFPAILVLLFGVIQAGIYYHAQQWASAAADRAAAVAAGLDATSGDGEEAAGDLLAGSICDLTSPVSVERNEAAGEVTATVRCALPGPLAPWPAEATSVAPVERFVPEQERS